MKEESISRIAVILLAIILAIFGIYHFVYPENLIAYVPSFLSGGITWVYVAGVALVLAGLALLAHKMVRVAGYLLAAMLVFLVLFIHLPNYLNAGDPDTKITSFIDILQNLAIAAFATYIASNAKKI